jgi:radical SAM superfamily enzyme YgiQ (UPF0313 family)
VRAGHRIRDAQQRLLQGETRRAIPSAGGGPAVVAVYPAEYAVGMANLGLHGVVETARRCGAEVDRAFLPDAKLIAEHRRTRAPLAGLETGRPLAEHVALLCSISFEPDYVGLVQVLRAAGLEPLAERRDACSPLVIAGGIAPTLNPEPIAPLCDLIGIGEAEALLPPLLALLRAAASRDELLAEAARLPGWYAPALGPYPVARQHAALERPCYPTVIARRAAFGGHVDVEISRGCRWRCRFCAAGHVVAPYRELGPAALEEAIAWGIAERGRVGLVGTDVSDHSELEAIVEEIWRRGGEAALPSLRVDALARAGSVSARLVRRQPPRTLTMAVEASSESLRGAVGKRLDDERLRGAVRQATEAGVEQVRLYFLVAIPGERWEEVEGIASTARELLELAPRGGLALSVNGVVPKPGTPLQWEAAPDRDYLRRARQALRSRLPRQRVELAFESPDWTRWQALLSLGGREVAPLVIEAAERGWRAALASAVAQGLGILHGRGRWPDGALPWAHVDLRTPETVLRAERARCLAREYVPPTLVARDAAVDG